MKIYVLTWKKLFVEIIYGEVNNKIYNNVVWFFKRIQDVLKSLYKDLPEGMEFDF